MKNELVLTILMVYITGLISLFFLCVHSTKPTCWQHHDLTCTYNFTAWQAGVWIGAYRTAKNPSVWQWQGRVTTTVDHYEEYKDTEDPWSDADCMILWAKPRFAENHCGHGYSCFCETNVIA